MMRAAQQLTAEYVRSVLSFDATTGVFTWRERPRSWFPSDLQWLGWNGKNAGKVAGHHDRKGYVRIGLLGRLHRAHRLVYLLLVGEVPAQIDHRNGVRHDNRPGNLRAGGDLVNARNQKLHATNTSGLAGVAWNKKMGKWTAYIGDGAKPRYLGGFASKLDAALARRAAELELGYDERHGRAA